MPTNQQRRQFLRQMVQSAASLSVFGSLGGPLALRQAMAAVDSLYQGRRHLVTIQNTGDSGWDTYSFHSNLNSNFLDAAKRSLTPIPYEEADGQWTSRDLPEYDDGGSFEHAKYGNDPYFRMAPGMSLFAGRMKNDPANDGDVLSNNLQLWLGSRWADGGHGIATYVYNGGMRSQYASSVSCLVAQKLAEQFIRTLHYVQLSGGMLSYQGFLGGVCTPINIPDLDSWKALTAPPAADPLASYQSSMGNALNRILAAADNSWLKKKISRTAFDNYIASVQSISKIRDAGTPAALAALTALQADYSAELTAVLATHPYGRRLKALKDAGVRVADFAASIAGHAFRFALAEYLIVNNLSAVIDIPGYFSDAHSEGAGGAYQNESCGLLLNFAGMRRLMRGLKKVVIDAEKGTTLYDVTHISMYSEFDRTPLISYASPAGKIMAGTGHGVTASVVMAGYGTNPGRVVGGLMHDASRSEYAALAQAMGTKAASMGAGLPIDFDTGRPSANGKYTYIENFLPTILSMYGITVPAQQLTNYGPIPALRKG